jgi:hypothetical protein
VKKSQGTSGRQNFDCPIWLLNLKVYSFLVAI